MPRLIIIFSILAISSVAGAQGGPPASDPVPEPTPERAPSEPQQGPTVDDLIVKASDIALANKRQWFRLGHWQDAFFGGFKSQADGMDFFLAKNGKKNPKAELEATLRAIFSGDPINDEHAACRFPARVLWLGKNLGFNGAAFFGSCPKFLEYVNGLKAKSLTLVFSSYYLRKAASAFGHTFFRIERYEPLATTEKRQLLDTGIDYSAQVTVKNPLFYALMGLTGQFRGTFRKMPYYYKVREYNDYESRDMWEYSIDLNDEQLTMFIAHVWELGHTYFDYFYLSENCGYHILGALEAANPDIVLLDHIRTPAIPADTIKALYKNPGLVKEVSYRPSLHTQFQSRLATLNGTQRTHLEKLVEDPEHKLPTSMATTEQIEVFDASVDLIDLRHAREVIGDTSSKPARFKQRILQRRSAVGGLSEELTIKPPWGKMPQLAHGTRRLRLGGGSTQDRGSYAIAELRIGLHDLADSPRGYPEHSSIEFFRLKARFSLDDSDLATSDLSIEDFSILSITNLIPLSRFTRGATWRVDFGGSRVYDEACDFCFVAHARVGGGIAFPLGERIAVWGMAGTLAAAGPRLDGINGAPIRLGVGPSGGMRLRLNSSAILLGEGEWTWLPTQEPFGIWQAQGTFRWLATSWLALDVVGGGRQGLLEGQLSALLYY